MFDSKADDDDGDDEHVSLGGWRSSVGMHISSGTAAAGNAHIVGLVGDAVREGRFRTIGIVHAHFVGRPGRKRHITILRHSTFKHKNS